MPNTQFFVELSPHFIVRNEGRVAAYKWAIQARWHSPDDADFYPDEREFPNRSSDSSIDINDRTLLPGAERTWAPPFGFALRSPDASGRRAELGRWLSGLDLSYRIATENGLTDYSRLSMKDMPNFDELLEAFLRV